jgi:hypothetical protein
LDTDGSGDAVSRLHDEVDGEGGGDETEVTLARLCQGGESGEKKSEREERETDSTEGKGRESHIDSSISGFSGVG